MGVFGSHYRLTMEHLNKVGQTKKIESEYIIESVHLDEIWHEITAFLTAFYPIQGFDWEEKLELGTYDIFISHDEYQRKAISYNDADTVKRIAENLLKIDKTEIQKLYFGENIINESLGENEKEILFDYQFLINLIDFYQRAATENNFVIINIS
jgi:hypothetical protein